MTSPFRSDQNSHENFQDDMGETVDVLVVGERGCVSLAFQYLKLYANDSWGLW